jgi:hypothetical protein
LFHWSGDAKDILYAAGLGTVLINVLDF